MENYKAKHYYQNLDVATQYNGERFTTWYGRLAHLTESQALQKALKMFVPREGTVLDLPCGTGRLFPILLKHGLNVMGGDISEEMISVARQLYAKQEKVSFAKVDAERIPFEDNHFDCLTSYRLFCHIPQEVRMKVLDEMVRVVKDVLILNFHVETLAPLYIFNSFFRKSTCPPHPLSYALLIKELERRQNIRILDVFKLSWYERSSMLVVLKKIKH